MIYHTYGTTGIELSAIGFGGLRFRDHGDIEGCAQLVKSAYDAGINYFDTAPGYGKSEEIFGVAFREMLPHRKSKPFFVSTKSNKSEPGEVRRDLETSLSRMGLDHVDFYHVWCVMSPGGYQKRVTGGALREFERLKDEGLVRHICLSTHMRGEDIAATLKEYPFEGVLLGYSAMNFAYRDKGVQAAAKLGRGVVVMNPLGGGIIPTHPDRFAFLKTREDETVVQGALRFLLSDPRITVSLVGFSSQAHIDEAIRTVDGFRPLPVTTRRRLRKNLATSFNSLCTGCGYCDNCPQDIPIPKFMDSFNHYILGGSASDMIKRLNYHWGVRDLEQLDQCTRCRQCEEACTQKLPILDRFDLMRREWKKAQKDT
jgi:predicted aldo/keto reductase-like oxidoreductase